MFTTPFRTICCGLAAGLLLCTATAIGIAQQVPLPEAFRTPSAPVIEAEALNLLRQNQEAMFKLKTYQAECRSMLTHEKPKPNQHRVSYGLAFLLACKPNKMRYDSWRMTEDPGPGGWRRPETLPTYTFACDGVDHFQQYGKVYRKTDRIAPEAMGTILEPWGGFYSTGASTYASIAEYRKAHALRTARLEGRERVGETLCDRVFTHVISSYNGQKYEQRELLYLGPDRLVRRSIRWVAFNDAPGMVYDDALRAIRVDAPIDPKVYAYVPPPGVTLEVPQPERPLLANGTPAPDFTARDAQGRSVKLSDYRGQVVVIDFWASWCGPCMASMPHNQTVMRKLKSAGLPVVLLAIDNGEERPAFESWVKSQGQKLSALTFAHIPPTEKVSDTLFQVTGIPTQYVLDPNGVIRASFVGYGGPTDDLEQAVRAALKPAH